MAGEAKKIPTWGYSKNGPKLFELSEGEGLPAGFYDHPDRMEEAETAPKARQPKVEPDAAPQVEDVKNQG